jgi:signal transduction histidine kinase
LVAVFAPATIVEGLVRSIAVLAVVVTCGLVPTLLWRRRCPALMVAIAFMAIALSEIALGRDPNMHTIAFVLLLAYALYRWGSGREVIVGTAIIAAKICLSTLLGYLSVGNALAGSAIVTATVAIGAAVRYRARARQRELDQAKLMERERLARDLHDTVAHHVSAMAIRAQAGLATGDSQPTAATDALRVIEAEASHALTEMRTLVRALRRDETPDRAPTPGIADLGQLAVASQPGPVVDIEVVGDLNGLPPAIGTAIYRLAQESVTNAQRHARHATRVHVRVAADVTSVCLRVTDDGDGPAPRSAQSPGYGLIGMIERANVLGGTVEAGPNPDRGWTVTAVLPTTIPLT